MEPETRTSLQPSTAGGVIPPPPDRSTPPDSTPRLSRPDNYPDPEGYRLADTLGAGGMGVVFAAEQLALGRTVAVKFLRTDGFPRPDLVARFRTEAAALARTPHPNIVQVFEVGEVGGRPFLVMELVPGGSLADKLAAGPLAPRAAAEVVRTLAGAVQGAHDQGIVHRDLKPANVLLAADGTPKVTDFGLAKPLADAAGNSPLATGATATGVILGTPSYMAPEQAGGDPAAVGPAADVYALGAILFECLTGRVPFRAASVIETLNLVLTADPPAPRQLQPGVARDLERICLTCLRKDPAKRYPSAAALADDLARFLAGRPIVARRVGLAERVVKWVRRNPAAAAVVFCVLAAGTAGTVGLMYHNARLQKALDAKTAEEAKAQRERELADENYRQAREAVRGMLARFEDRRYTDVPRLRELHKTQAAAALAYFRAVARLRGDPSPEVRYDAARADFEAGSLHARLGEPGPAADHFRRAIDGYDRLVADAPGNLQYRAERANTRAYLGNATLAPDEELRLAAEAAAELTAVAADPAATFDHKSTLANVLNSLGAKYVLRGKYADAEPHLLAAYDLRQGLAAARPDDPWTARQLADILSNLSSLYRLTGRVGPAAEFHDPCEARLQALVDADPDDRHAVTTLATERVNWTYVLAKENRHTEAIDRLTRILPPLERLHKLEPNDLIVRDALYRVYGVRGEMYGAAGRHTDAVVDGERLLAVCPPDRRRFHGWFVARTRVSAGDPAGAVRDLERLNAELGRPDKYGEPLHGAETAVWAAARVRVAAAAASAGPAALLDRAEGLAVGLIEKAKGAAGPAQWLVMAPQIGAEPAFQLLRGRDDFKKLMGGK